MKKPLAKKPIGASEHGWNTIQIGTDGPVQCEICGVVHPENREQSYHLSEFLGFQVVDQCCGSIIDRVYRELGKVFAFAFMEEFAENPGDIRFYTLRCVLNDALKKAAKKLAEVSRQVAEISEAVNTISEQGGVGL